jgi:hypothetical protein
MADCHVGSWRDPKLKDLSIEAFSKSIAICIDNNVDFILIAGDLFNNALPGIDNLKVVVKEFKKLKEKDIPIYIIPGSHDYSPSGKTMIDVLEEAGLLKNVFKGHVEDNKLFLDFTLDKKTGVKIAGILGRRGTLEKNYYEALDIESLEKESGTKIFLFHSAIAEMMPKEFALIESTPISMLPSGFEYYAGGHIHIIKHESFKEHKNVVYPGPLFPASFSELEKLSNGGFYIYDDGKLQREELNLKNTFFIDVDVNHKSSEEVYTTIMDKIQKKEFINTIVLLRIHGTLSTGKVSDIKFNEISNKIYSQGAFYVMKNTSKLQSEEFEEIKIDHDNIDNVEDVLIKEHLQQFNLFDKEKEYSTIKDLMKSLSAEKHEGEKVHEYEDRIRKETDKVLDV